MKLEWKNWTLFSLLTLLMGASLRLFLANAPLVSDELASISVWAQMPFLEIPSNYQYPNNHIFHTMVLHLILNTFGVNHALLRFPVLFCGIFSLILAYLTALKITKNKSISLGVLILLAVNTKHIYFSTYARGYIIITFFVQLILYLLLVQFQNGSGKWLSSPPKPVGAGLFLTLGLIGFLGTWTLPTFIFFVVTISFFFGTLLFWNFRDQIFNFRFPYTRVCLTLALVFAGFYLQYYVLISKEMLSVAVSRAGASGSAQFLPGLLDLFIYPLKSVRYVFLLLAGVGLFCLFRKDRILFFLFSCLFFIPLTLPYLGTMAGVLPAIPPQRAFFYLQPFFFIFVCMGGFFLLHSVYGWFGKGPSDQQTGRKIIQVFFYLLFVPIVFLFGMEFKDETYPEIISRKPYHKILEFLKNLGPQDLFFTSTRAHVWFYLYGANEMRIRVNNIIDKGELADVYFLEDSSKNDSDINRTTVKGTNYFQLKDYHSLNSAGKSELLNIPAEIFQLAAHFQDFKIHKIKPQYIQKVYELKDAKDYFDRWLIPNNQSVNLELVKIGSGTQIAIKYQHPFFIISKELDSSEENLFNLNINLISVGNSINASVLYYNGTAQNNRVSFNSTWFPNDWVIDHPYGPGIYKRPWRPAIFLSKSGRSFEVIQAFGLNKNSTGYLRGIQSYRISLKNNSPG